MGGQVKSDVKEEVAVWFWDVNVAGAVDSIVESLGQSRVSRVGST